MSLVPHECKRWKWAKYIKLNNSIIIWNVSMGFSPLDSPHKHIHACIYIKPKVKLGDASALRHPNILCKLGTIEYWSSENVMIRLHRLRVFHYCSNLHKDFFSWQDSNDAKTKKNGPYAIVMHTAKVQISLHICNLIMAFFLWYVSQHTTKPIIRFMLPAKTQISLHIHIV